MDDAFTIATGVVEDEGKIIEAGDFDDLINKYPQAEKVMNYENDYLYPGFVEPHSHPMLTSYILGNCTLIDFKYWDFWKIWGSSWMSRSRRYDGKIEEGACEERKRSISILLDIISNVMERLRPKNLIN